MSDPEEQKSRRAKRRAEASRTGDASGDGSEIKDRNQRLREEAAAKRRGKRDKQRKAAVGQGLDASEMVDDALARGTHNLTRWGKAHFNKMQWVVVAGIAAGTAWTIYRYRQQRHDEKASDALMIGVVAQEGRVSSEDDLQAQDGRVFDNRPVFDSDTARIKAAREAYQKTIDQHKTWNGVELARLGLAGTLLDEGKYKEARAAFENVRSSAVAAKDGDVRARALEGMGLAAEALKDPDGALKAFRELENSDVFGIRPLGQYHQARILFAQGKRDEAKVLLKKIVEKLGKPSDGVPPQAQLLEFARKLLAEIDPKEAQAMAESNVITPEMLQQLQKQGGLKDPKKLAELLKQLSSSPEGLPPPPTPEAPSP